MSRTNHYFSLILLFLFFLSCHTPPSESPQKLPNIIFILADDMGYGDVQALNPSSNIPTPSLNRLAEEGMTFTDAHTPSAVCTPTRYGLLTGRYCWRSRLKRGVQNGYGKPLIEASRTTVASLLKRKGYHTGIVGKWHLGLGFGIQADSTNFDFHQTVNHGPHILGFDESYIIPASLDFPPYVYIHNGQITAYPDSIQQAQKFPAFLRKGEISPDFNMEECLDHLLKKSLSYIETQANQAQPFFLYFPLTAPHKPVLPHTRFRDKTSLGPYGDFVAQVDWTVGEVLKKLDELNIADNTLLIYSSDNGSFMYKRNEVDAVDHIDDERIQAYRQDRHTANYVFRGTKADIWEAGHHVPFFVRWPQQIVAGTKNNHTICLTDFMATIAEITQDSLLEGEAPDSFSFLPLLKKEDEAYMRPPVIHHSANGTFAIRQGRWKLVLGNGSGGREKPRGEPFGRPFELYDMSHDYGEKQNVIEEHPQVAEQMEAWCNEIIEREEYDL